MHPVRLFVGALNPYLGQSAHREDLAGAHVLEKVAHGEIGTRLHIGRWNAKRAIAELDEAPRIGPNGKAEHVEVAIALDVALFRSSEHQALRNCSVLRTEDDGGNLLIFAFDLRLR